MAKTYDELWRHIELHAAEAHGENPKAWSPAEMKQMKDLFNRV